ncbi:MAG TPA: FkbM family methyltransferase [Longimicrobiaceae bacterium]|nr:FkbM family methyltransferase [Longimicrobiaceae bacterium]
MLREALIDTLRPYHFRGKLRLLAGMAPRTGERTARLFGYDVRLDLAEAIQRWIYLGAFEPQETAAVRRWLRPGMTFVDVGANVGYFTLLAASRVGETGRVFAVEPSPYAHDRLNAAVSANRLAQVRTFRMGLSSTEGELNLYLPPESDGFHSPTMSASSWETLRVPVRRLDDCLDEWGVRSVDLIKLDVEGHEAHVLEGAAGALETGRVRAVLCEFNDHWLRQQGSSPRALHDTLVRAGFVDQEGVPDFGADGCETRFLVHRSALAGR